MGRVVVVGRMPEDGDGDVLQLRQAEAEPEFGREQASEPGVHGDHDRRPGDQRRDHEETRRGEHDRAPQPELRQSIVLRQRLTR
jgi:hypothetical protein